VALSVQVHPALHILLTLQITSAVAFWSLGLLFRDGDETNRAVQQCPDSWAPELWMRGKFGVWLTIVMVTAISSYQGVPLLWEYLKSILA
jgi:hypothetical protein